MQAHGPPLSLLKLIDSFEKFFLHYPLKNDFLGRRAGSRWRWCHYMIGRLKGKNQFWGFVTFKPSEENRVVRGWEVRVRFRDFLGFWGSFGLFEEFWRVNLWGRGLDGDLGEGWGLFTEGDACDSRKCSEVRIFDENYSWGVGSESLSLGFDSYRKWFQLHF